MISKFRGRSKRIVLLGNLLAGLALWELAESVIEAIFGSELILKFIFYASCFLVTYGLIVYLESTNRLYVIDSGMLSPI